MGDDETFVIDWGLAADVSPDPDADRSAPTRAGTAPYTAPEVFDPAEPSPFSPKSDVYSLGALLHLILTGAPPYSGASSPAVIEQIRQGPPRAALADLPCVPRALSRICARALSRSPGDRYSTADAMARDIEAWIARDRVSADREPWNERAKRWALRHRIAVLTASIVLVAVASVALISTARVRAARREQEAVSHRRYLRRQEVASRALEGERLFIGFEDPGLQEALALFRPMFNTGASLDPDPKRYADWARSTFLELKEREEIRAKSARAWAISSKEEIREAFRQWFPWNSTFSPRRRVAFPSSRHRQAVPEALHSWRPTQPICRINSRYCL